MQSVVLYLITSLHSKPAFLVPDPVQMPPWSFPFKLIQVGCLQYLCPRSPSDLLIPSVNFHLSISIFLVDSSGSPISLKENIGHPPWDFVALNKFHGSGNILVKWWNNPQFPQIKHKCPSAQSLLALYITQFPLGSQIIQVIIFLLFFSERKTSNSNLLVKCNFTCDLI
jgi:hypothetical protein